MQSRSARWLSRAFVSFSLALAPGGAAWATLTITPKNFSQKIEAASTTIYYASTLGTGVDTVFNRGGDSPFTDPLGTFGVVNLSLSVGADTNQALSFLVSSTVTIAPTAPEIAVLVVRVATSSSAAVIYAPIASNTTGTLCTNAAPNLCPKPVDATNIVVSPNVYFYSTPFIASGTTISIFPKDICVNSDGNGTLGCDGTSVKPADPATATTPAHVPMTLTFKVVYINPTTGVLNSAVVDSLDIKPFFQASVQDWNCPTVTELGDRYFPGDGEVSFNTTGFGGSTSGFAPHMGVIAVGSRSGAPVRDTTFNTANEFYSLVGFGENQKLGSPDFGTGPMVNSTDGTDNAYTIDFMVRDAMGVINPVSRGNACTISGIRSASIQTFLGQSKCFIATAAFRSIDAAPVEMLRQFRDKILLPTELGSTFVDWYYDWSPQAAEWLMEHPQARFPVLRALVPLQIGAWLLLHPLSLTLLGLGILLVLREHAFE